MIRLLLTLVAMLPAPPRIGAVEIRRAIVRALLLSLLLCSESGEARSSSGASSADFRIEVQLETEVRIADVFLDLLVVSFA